MPLNRELLRKLIEKDARSMSQIAREADIDPGNMVRILDGNKDIQLGTLDRIAKALGVRVQRLIK